MNPSNIPTFNPSYAPTFNPSYIPTLEPSYAPTIWTSHECIAYCETDNCLGNNENPYCSQQITYSIFPSLEYGCGNCQNGYWIQSKNQPCVSCDIIPNCLKCKNYIGCDVCEPGYTKTLDKSCGYEINYCHE